MEAVTYGKGIPAFECGCKDAPAVIVLQEWWGVTDMIKAHAIKISENGGYRCLVPDLYRGKLGVDKEEASHLMSNLDFKAAIGEITQANEYLRATGSPRVGCTGFCMGGALTFCAAQHSGVDCGVSFYGIPAPEICTPTDVKVPFQGHFGVLDTLKGFSDIERAKDVEEKMKAAACNSEFFFYEGAGHAFMNEGEEADKKRDYMEFVQPPPEVRSRAWARLLEFFHKVLQT